MWMLLFSLLTLDPIVHADKVYSASHNLENGLRDVNDASTMALIVLRTQRLESRRGYGLKCLDLLRSSSMSRHLCS